MRTLCECGYYIDQVEHVMGCDKQPDVTWAVFREVVGRLGLRDVIRVALDICDDSDSHHADCALWRPHGTDAEPVCDCAVGRIADVLRGAK